MAILLCGGRHHNIFLWPRKSCGIFLERAQAASTSSCSFQMQRATRLEFRAQLAEGTSEVKMAVVPVW